MNDEAHVPQRTVEPIVTAQRIVMPIAELEIVVPTELVYFDGHFPGAPIVPGIVQIKWALDLARCHLDVGTGFRRIERLKFQRIMSPGTRAKLTLTYAVAAGKLDFSFAAAETRYSSGRFVLRGSQ